MNDAPTISPTPSAGASREPAVRARALAKTFRSGGVDVLALRGVEIALHAGEFVAVIGPSGCGKSTMLHLLGGLDRPTAGEVMWQGRRIDDLSETKLARLRRSAVGFVFQFFNLVPNLTAGENIELSVLLAGGSRADARARSDELLERMGIADRAHAAPAQLSGGEQQRVAIARALANRPAVVLADEPTGNLDSASARDVLSLLREARADGQALLLVTHDARVAATADRVVTMRDGLVYDEVAMIGPRPVSDLVSFGSTA